MAAGEGGGLHVVAALGRGRCDRQLASSLSSLFYGNDDAGCHGRWQLASGKHLEDAHMHVHAAEQCGSSGTWLAAHFSSRSSSRLAAAATVASAAAAAGTASAAAASAAAAERSKQHAQRPAWAVLWAVLCAITAPLGGRLGACLAPVQGVMGCGQRAFSIMPQDILALRDSAGMLPVEPSPRRTA